MILYDTCIPLCHIYEKNNIGTAWVGHLHNPYCIRIITLTRGHPSSTCRFSFELTEILRIMQLYFSGIIPFSLDILTRNNTTVLTRCFSLQPLNNHMIIEYCMMIILNYLPL